MPITESYHETLRGLVADALGDAITSAGFSLTVTEQDEPRLDRVNFPAVIVSYAGSEQISPATNLRNDIQFPLLISLFTREPSEDPPGISLTIFREIVREAFHERRLSGAADVLYCLVSGITNPIQMDPQVVQQLRTALIVTPVARRPRGTL